LNSEIEPIEHTEHEPWANNQKGGKITSIDQMKNKHPELKWNEDGDELLKQLKGWEGLNHNISIIIEKLRQQRE